MKSVQANSEQEASAIGHHTPLPWRVFTNRDGTKLVGIGGKDGEGILDAGFGVWSWNDPEGIANAELVVRAVNNFDALVKALEGIASFDADNGCECGMCRMAKTARAALASAKGE